MSEDFYDKVIAVLWDRYFGKKDFRNIFEPRNKYQVDWIEQEFKRRQKMTDRKNLDERITQCKNDIAKLDEELAKLEKEKNKKKVWVAANYLSNGTIDRILIRLPMRLCNQLGINVPPMRIKNNETIISINTVFNCLGTTLEPSKMLSFYDHVKPILEI